jgi:hypothetical protein
MRKKNQPSITLLVIVVALALAGWLLYQIPAVHERLSWRLDIAQTYARGMINPVKPLPTTIAEATHTPAPTQVVTPTATATLRPTNEPSPTPTFTPTPIPGSVILPSPAYTKQGPNNCGPASLTMYLNYYGWKGTQKDIADVIKPLDADRNVNVEELIYFVRNHAGWLNAEFRVGGDTNLLKQFLAAGIPVVIEESFNFAEDYWPNDDGWAAHYFLVTGYDDATQTFTGQDSYFGPDQKVPYKDLDSKWKIFNRVMILVYTPQQQGTVQAILGPDWDVDYNRKHALETAQAEAKANPNDAFAWFNIGSNQVYFDQYEAAVEAYQKAITIGLPQRMMRYQFGPFFAYFHTGRTEDLAALADYALQRTPNSEEALLWKGWALYRQGKNQDAIQSFQKALDANPMYLDAQYAMDFVAANP